MKAINNNEAPQIKALTSRIHIHIKDNPCHTIMELFLALDRLQKLAIFIAAAAFFIFASQKCVVNYLKFQTARSLEILQSKNFIMPEITVCLDITLNPEVLSKYGYTSSLSYILGPWQGRE